MSYFTAPIAEAIWDMKYRFKDAAGNPIDETVEATWERIAHALSQVELGLDDSLKGRKAHRRAFYNALEDFKYLPAGRITAGAGTGRAVTLFNCFVMGTVPDDMGGIFDMLKEAALTMQQGGGIGYDFSPLRPKGSPVKGVAADASGPLTFMDVWDAMCRTVMSAGSRRGAMMATLRCDHPDIFNFIEAKKDPARLRMFNMSVLVTNGFMEAVRDDEMWDLVHDKPPAKHDGRDTVEHVSANGHVERLSTRPDGKYYYHSVKARDLWDAIMRNTYAQAEPGVIFIDRINESNNLNYCETIAATNPCGEQPLPPYGACLLGSINLAKFVTKPFRYGTIDPVNSTFKDLDQTVATAIRMMDNVVDTSNFPLPAQKAEALAKRRLGLGVTGLADMLVMLGLRYGSPEAVALTDNVMKRIAIAAYNASVDLAIEKGPFPMFDADKFLAPGTFASTLPDELKDRIRKHGIRNSHLTSVAPTGTISLYAGNVSSGIEPIFAFAYTRKVLQPDGTRTEERVEDYAVQKYREHFYENVYSPDDYESSEWSLDYLPEQFVSSQTLSPMAHVRMQAAAQRWVDSSISKTINCPEDISFEDFKEVYMAAWDAGCKGCTTYRPNEVTGSVLSVDAPAEAPKKASDPIYGMVEDEAKAYLRRGGEEARTLMRAKLTELGVSKVVDLLDDVDGQHKLWHWMTVEQESGLWGDSPECPEGKIVDDEDGPKNDPHFEVNWGAQEEPTARPQELPGVTYKIKLGGEDHAIYVTVTDIMEHGVRRPFEVFINSKNMAHFAWTVALTRMVSAVFRRNHDSSFVVEELKAVFDPKGGSWQDGKFIPSVPAAIGHVIEQHMRSINYGAFAVTKQDARVAEKTARHVNEGLRRAVATPPGELCDKCYSSNVKKESGCFVCKDCGHSKCG